jgi:carboxylate-amine ligase
VHQFDVMIDRGYTLPTPRAWLVRENKWRAARHGLDASIIVDESGTTVPLRKAIRELVEDLTPIATRLGCTTELRGALDIMERGSSYIRQREVVEAGGSLTDVVDSLIAELHADKASPRSAVLEAIGKQVVAAAD